MLCLWCNKKLATEEAGRSNLCSDCEQTATGMPSLSEEQLDKLPYGVIRLNKSGVILAFNEAESRMSGLSRVDVIGRNFFAVIAPCSDVKEFRGRFDDFLESNQLSARFNFTYHFSTHSIKIQIIFLRVNQYLAFVLSKRV